MNSGGGAPGHKCFAFLCLIYFCIAAQNNVKAIHREDMRKRGRKGSLKLTFERAYGISGWAAAW